jgi:hypothetical protein
MQPELLHTTAQVMTPFVQYGFAGLAFLQLGVLVWLGYKAVEVIARNTQVIERLNERDMEQARKIDEIRDWMILNKKP